MCIKWIPVKDIIYRETEHIINPKSLVRDDVITLIRWGCYYTDIRVNKNNELTDGAYTFNCYLDARVDPVPVLGPWSGNVYRAPQKRTRYTVMDNFVFHHAVKDYDPFFLDRIFSDFEKTVNDYWRYTYPFGTYETNLKVTWVIQSLDCLRYQIIGSVDPEPDHIREVKKHDLELWSEIETTVGQIRSINGRRIDSFVLRA